jgi:hypothetical protein
MQLGGDVGVSEGKRAGWLNQTLGPGAAFEATARAARAGAGSACNRSTPFVAAGLTSPPDLQTRARSQPLRVNPGIAGLVQLSRQRRVTCDQRSAVFDAALATRAALSPARGTAAPGGAVLHRRRPPVAAGTAPPPNPLLRLGADQSRVKISVSPAVPFRRERSVQDRKRLPTGTLRGPW